MMRSSALVTALLASGGVASAATLDLTLDGDFFEGGPAFEVSADGVNVLSGVVNTEGGENFSVEVPDDTTLIAIGFTNDKALPLGPDGNRAADRNLIIHSVAFNGKNWTGAELQAANYGRRGSALVLYSNGQATIEVALSKDATENGSSCEARSEISGFGNGAIELTAEQKADIDALMLDSNCRISVIGFSSTSGRASVNKMLSEARAEAVSQYLSTRGSFRSLEATGAGETDQFGSDQAMNRKVVIEVR
ncbi:MAG: OmpA family protein [Alphaproteobacteria bacterium]|nr:OmpA family protein [Alphaproteobacteria bacterium]MBU1551332.1 OmpA family protein [Alphaproteobacteria bacterium]MBU2334733.1 OmpA family protein [Alphaproteobacteria bacterium]MBU2389236.1 OmpA family protein [Alphaproteobacteria bacterium]